MPDQIFLTSTNGLLACLLLQVFSVISCTARAALANSSKPWPACWEQALLGSSLQIPSRMATGAKLLLWHPSAIQVLFFIPLFPVFLLPCQTNVALAESSILGNYLRYSLPEDPEIGFFLRLVPEKNQRKGRQKRFVSFGADTLRAMFAGSFCSPCEISGQSNKELASLGTSIPIVSTQMTSLWRSQKMLALAACNRFLQKQTGHEDRFWSYLIFFLKLVSVNKGN